MVNREASGRIVIVVLACIVCAIVLVPLWMWGWPNYKVWCQEMEGRAALRRAEQEKQIIIETAKAEVEAAKLRAQAIEAVGEAAQKYPEYRTQEFIGAFAEAIQSGSIDQIIYVPTEASIPIVEAGRIGSSSQ